MLGTLSFGSLSHEDSLQIYLKIPAYIKYEIIVVGMKVAMQTISRVPCSVFTVYLFLLM